jgi:membrane-bound lytic murein transglycosylase MltF
MVGTDIYVSPLTSFYEHLMKLNEERVKAAKTQLSVKPADKNLQQDDLIEMVNAGLIAATAAMQHRANLWEQILPNGKVHPEMVIASEGELAWVMRKNNPQLKELLDQFTETHGEGILFGNILPRRYLKTRTG